jgi:hypothetical protein
MIQKDPLVRRQLIEQLSALFDSPAAGRTLEQKRNYLINCIDSHGYIAQRTIRPESETDDVRYSEIQNRQFYQPENVYSEYSDTSTYTDALGYNRTFINAPEYDRTGQKLVKIQQRGISAQETNIQKLRELLEVIVNQINSNYYNLDVSQIVNTALSFYNKILNYYSSGNIYNLETNTKGIKKGYAVLCVEYSLIVNGSPVEIEQILHYFNQMNVVVPNLPKVRTYFLKIIPELQALSSRNTMQTSKCNVILNLLPYKIQNQVHEVLKHFTHDYTTAAIYFICSSKSVYQNQIPVMINGSIQKVTLKLLEENCKPPSSTKISKNAQEIAAFYNQNYNLREILLSLGE